MIASSWVQTRRRIVAPSKVRQIEANVRETTMTTLKTIVAAGAVIVATTGLASAQGRIDRTQSEQAWQIEQGRQNGQITRREYRDLQAEQARIAEIERRAKADGHVTRREAREIVEAQRDASNHIYTESHDRQSNWLRRFKSGN
jgi:hypothetical protein